MKTTLTVKNIFSADESVKINWFKGKNMTDITAITDESVKS